MAEAKAEAEWECAICYQLLLDPVVGVCGHDFCRECLHSWAKTCDGKAARVQCPLCREELAPNAAAAQKLGVCIRLKRMLESLYPDKIAQRRQERVDEESRQAQAQRTAHQQLIRQGRTRFLRARRTRNLSIGAGSGLESGSTGAGSASPAFGTPATPLSQDNQQQQISLFATPLQTGFAPAALNAHATDVAGTQQAPWQAPAAVVFTMGWWETPSKGSRRRRAAQRLRTAMHAGGFAAPAAPAQATLVR